MGQGRRGMLRCPWPLDLYELHFQRQRTQDVSLLHGRKVEGPQWSPPSWFSFFPSRFLEVHPHMHMHTHVHTLLAVLCIFPTSPSESLCFLAGHPSSSMFIATKTIFLTLLLRSYPAREPHRNSLLGPKGIFTAHLVKQPHLVSAQILCSPRSRASAPFRSSINLTWMMNIDVCLSELI